MRLIKLRVGDKVRIVQMNGCMAHVRDNPREGVVIDFVEKKGLLWTSMPRVEKTFAKIRLETGELIEKCSAPRLWIKHDGLPEYQE